MSTAQPFSAGQSGARLIAQCGMRESNPPDYRSQSSLPRLATALSSPWLGGKMRCLRFLTFGTIPSYDGKACFCCIIVARMLQLVSLADIFQQKHRELLVFVAKGSFGQHASGRLTEGWIYVSSLESDSSQLK